MSKQPWLKKDIPKGMFIVSKGVHKACFLTQWQNHFKAKGIKTKIISAGDRFYLCREGIEAG